MYIAGREEETVQLASYRETVIFFVFFFGVGTSTVSLSVRPSFSFFFASISYSNQSTCNFGCNDVSVRDMKCSMCSQKCLRAGQQLPEGSMTATGIQGRHTDCRRGRTFRS